MNFIFSWRKQYFTNERIFKPLCNALVYYIVIKKYEIITTLFEDANILL